MWLFPLGAAVVSAAFAGAVGLQWLSRRRPHHAAWAVALAMFGLASLAAAVGLLQGWSPFWYRTYYLFGAIVNVPVLGLGTIYLLAPPRVGHIVTVGVAIASAYAAGAVFTAELDVAGLAGAGIPAGSEVMPGAIRSLSRYYSFTGFFVVVGGALWSAWRLARSPDESLRSLATANVLIAAGTTVVAIASGFARFGRGAVFSVGLLVGIVLMFAGFLKARRPQSAR